MSEGARYAVLDLETRCHLPLARSVLGLEVSVAPAEVLRRVVEKQRAENHGSDFLKLPFHEPVAAAILLVERSGAAPTGPLLASEWRCWRAGEAPMGQFVRRFFEILADRTYVGFNSQAFDLPLMELWASRCRVAAPEHFDRSNRSENPRYKYGELHLDLRRELVNWASGSGSFDELCKFHGLPGKPGVSGEEVEALVAEGRLEEVHAYNVTDVVQTHLLFLHTLVRSGRLTVAAAAESAQSALALTREKLLVRLAPGSAARAVLEPSLQACERAPIAAG